MRTVEGRRLRRSVLKGAVVAFITAGYSGKRFVFEKAAELGVKAVVLDAPDSWAQLMEGEGVISQFVPIDFSDAENVFDHCLEVRGALRSGRGVLRCADGKLGAGCRSGSVWRCREQLSLGSSSAQRAHV